VGGGLGGGLSLGKEDLLYAGKKSLFRSKRPAKGVADPFGGEEGGGGKLFSQEIMLRGKDVGEDPKGRGGEKRRFRRLFHVDRGPEGGEVYKGEKDSCGFRKKNARMVYQEACEVQALSSSWGGEKSISLWERDGRGGGFLMRRRGGRGGGIFE